MKKSMVLFGLLICLAGCATAPSYPKYEGNDAACIKGNTRPDLIKAFTAKEANISIKEINGTPVGADPIYCFAPGRHRLKVSASGSDRIGEDYADLTFNAGRQYYLRANLQGDFRRKIFAFQFIDITDQPGRLVAEFHIDAFQDWASNPGLYVPIR